MYSINFSTFLLPITGFILIMTLEIEVRFMTENFYLGNTSRFHKLFRKASEGKPVSLLFLGASVTFGYKIPENDQFPVRIQKYLCNTYQNDAILLHNRSVPGLSSMHALYQCYQEAEALSPDLIVLDHSINDQKNPDFRESYESLLTKALLLPSKPAILSFFVKSETNYSCAPQMSAANEHYGIAYVDIGEELDECIANGKIRWSDYSYDDKHPGPVGHHFIADRIITLLQMLDDSENTPCILPEDAFFRRDLAYLSFAGKEWADASGNFPKQIELTLTCRTLFLSYMVDIVPEMGCLSVEIDGKNAFSLDSYRVHEWQHPEYKIFHIGPQKETHRIVLSTEAGGHKIFHLLALCYF